jgi:glycolate oxidase subunit GlcD
MVRSRLTDELVALVGAESVLPVTPAYLRDATESRGLEGRAEAVVLPETAEDVARIVGWCYEHDVPLVPRGGGTGFAGGAVPLEKSIVLGLERLRRVRAFEPLLWRMHVEAGLPTAEVRRVARESGLLFPPDPGAAEQSQLGGNIATNAGGPHAFKYGVTGAWVLGLEAVVPPGELVQFGGPLRKDVAAYDLKSLLIGSEGTLGVITAAWLRLLPAPEASLPVAAFYETAAAGCEAIERVLGNGIVAAALEFLDEGALISAGGSFPGGIPRHARFLVLAEADGSREEANRVRGDLLGALETDSVGAVTPEDAADLSRLWRWRDGVSIAVTARLGGKVSEDVSVPVDRLCEAIEGTISIAGRHRLEACSWGHAGDGNLHSTFMLTRGDDEALSRAEAAAAELFDLAVRLGGSVSGEHGVGWTKRGRLGLQLAPRAVEIHSDVKRAFDPKGLLNPGKKV